MGCRIWKRIAKIGIGGFFSGFSPADGKKIVTSDGKTTRLWDTESGKELQKFEGHFCGFSPDGKKIVTSSNGITYRILDTGSGKESPKLDGNFPRFSPDGKKIATSDRKTTRLWDTESGKELQKFEGHLCGFSPDGKKIVTRSDNETSRILDVASGKELQKLDGYFRSFSPDGKKIVMGIYNETSRILDVASGKELLKGDFQGFSPDGKKIVIGQMGSDEDGISYEAASSEEDGRSDFDKGRTSRIWDLSALEKRASAVDWKAESGFEDIKDFVQFVRADLREKLVNAEEYYRNVDEFDKADAQTAINAVRTEIKTAKADIAPKTFCDAYDYVTADVKVEGDQSSFTMTIPTGFAASKVEKILFPMRGMTGKAGNGADKIVLSVSGSTDDIRELVRNSGNYQADVWFKNLRYNSEDNTVSADVLRIEIVKVK